MPKKKLVTNLANKGEGNIAENLIRKQVLSIMFMKTKYDKENRTEFKIKIG